MGETFLERERERERLIDRMKCLMRWLRIWKTLCDLKWIKWLNLSQKKASCIFQFRFDLSKRTLWTFILGCKDLGYFLFFQANDKVLWPNFTLTGDSLKLTGETGCWELWGMDFQDQILPNKKCLRALVSEVTRFLASCKKNWITNSSTPQNDGVSNRSDLLFQRCPFFHLPC